MKGHDPKQALLSAVEFAGGQSELARRLGIRQQSVNKWLGIGRVPAARVLDVERAVEGKVARHQMRPDIYPPEENRPFGDVGSDSQDAEADDRQAVAEDAG